MKTRSLMFLIPLLLAGCGGADGDNIQAWMADQGAMMHGKVDPLPPVVPFIPIAFIGTDGQDPFTAKQAAAKNLENTPAASKLMPDLNRKKEFLEGYPLDNLQLVGIVKRFNVNWALIKSPEGNVNMVKAGNYLGQNYGKILKVSLDGLSLKETSQNAQGEWTEREFPIDLKDDGK